MYFCYWSDEYRFPILKLKLTLGKESRVELRKLLLKELEGKFFNAQESLCQLEKYPANLFIEVISEDTLASVSKGFRFCLKKVNEDQPEMVAN
ncbi:hypothetical protein ACLOJK_001671 [Asimina triloba]